MMYVRPAFRGYGIGKALVHTLMDEARNMDCSIMRLETITYLKDAIRLYHALGFQDIEPYYKVEHSLASICLFMERRLTSGSEGKSA